MFMTVKATHLLFSAVRELFLSYFHDPLLQLADESYAAVQHNVSFVSSSMLGDVNKSIQVLVESVSLPILSPLPLFSSDCAPNLILKQKPSYSFPFPPTFFAAAHI